MTNKEPEKVAEAIQKIELNLLHDWGLKNINGGFVDIQVYDWTDDLIHVEIISGVQCGSEDDYTTSENGSIDRKTLELL